MENITSSMTSQAGDAEVLMNATCMNRTQMYGNFFQFQYVVEVYVVSVVCGLGLIGNLLSFVVIGQMKGSKSVPILLRCLALADCGYLIASFFIQTCRTLYFTSAAFADAVSWFPYVQVYVWPLAAATQTTSVWLVVLITCDRYLAICHPLRAKRLVTRGRARVAVLCVVVGAVLFNVPTLFDMRVLLYTDPCRQVTRLVAFDSPLIKDQAYQLVYKTILCFAFRTVIPLVMVAVLNYRLLSTMRSVQVQGSHHRHQQQRHRRHNRLPLDPDQQQQQQSRHGEDHSAAWRIQHTTSKTVRHADQLTALIVGVVIVFITCETPDAIFRCLRTIKVYGSRVAVELVHLAYLGTLTNLLLTVNSSVNFVIYCTAGQRFQQILCDVYCRCGRRRDGGMDRGTRTAYSSYGLTKTSTLLSQERHTSNPRKSILARPVPKDPNV